MLKTYGVSKDISYHFNNLLTEEIEKRKEETDSDKLISNDNIDSIRDNNYNYYNKNILPSYILKYRQNIDDLRKLKNLILGRCHIYMIIICKDSFKKTLDTLLKINRLKCVIQLLKLLLKLKDIRKRLYLDLQEIRKLH